MKISVKSVANIFLSIGIFVILSMLTGIATIFDDLRITYAHPFLAFISVVAGPVSGAITGFVGQLIVQVHDTVLDWPAVICTVLNCIAIGYFSRSIEIRDGIFEKKEMVLFNKVQIISNLIIWAIVYPVFTHFLTKASWESVIITGIKTSLAFITSCMTAATLLLGIYARSRITPENFYRN